MPETDQPRVAFPAEAYALTAAQEARLIDHAFSRLGELERDLGRDQVKNEDWWRDEGRGIASGRARTWMGKRMAYEMTYENEVEWRRHALGGIFAESNWIVPISRRVVSQQVSRANGYFFGTDPWLAVDAQGTEDEELARASDRWVKHKFAGAKVRHYLEAAVERAFIRGECVLKHAHVVRDDIYAAPMTVLIDPQTKEPRLGDDGEVITREDKWIPGEQPGQEVLARDGVTLRPQGEWERYERRVIPRRVTRSDGPELRPVYFKDFLCPLNAESVEEADVVAHLYDETVASMVDRYGRDVMGLRPEEDAPPPPTPEATLRAVEAFLGLEGNQDERGGGGFGDVGAGASWRPEREEDVAARSPRRGNQRGASMGGPERSVARLAEFWMRWDADEDGIMEHIVLVVDRETRQPIYYNHAALETPDGKRPFSVVRVNPVDGRWYGVGSMQIFETIQALVDLQFNRWNFSQTRAGRIDLFRAYNTVEGQVNSNLDLNWGGTLTPVEGKSAADVIESVYLNDIKSADLKQLVEFQLQLAMNMSGVSHANDLAMAGGDSIKTATGTLNVEKMGHEMFGQLISHLESGIGDAVQAAADLALIHMHPVEAFRYFDGATAVFGQIKRGDMDSVRLNLRLTLTRHRGEQQMESASSAANLAREYYEIPDPWAAAKLAPLYRQALRALQISDADAMIEPRPMPGMDGEPPPGEEAGLDPSGAGQGQTAPHGLHGEGLEPPAGTAKFAAQMDGGRAGGLAAQGG
jgi:hypothetical protein